MYPGEGTFAEKVIIHSQVKDALSLEYFKSGSIKLIGQFRLEC